MPQTIVGTGYTTVSNWAWQVDKVDYWGGATVSSGQNWGLGAGAAVTLSNYITGGRNLKADPNNSLFQHEYGHYLQSQSMGWAYLPRVGIPSLMSTMNYDDGNHDFQLYEQDANRRAFTYFNENVDGFYQTATQYRANQSAGVEKGWNFYQNPMDINHIGNGSRRDYYDYYNSTDRALVNSLVLRAKWYDYAGWLGGISGALVVGGGNGVYYNKRRIK